MYKLFFISLFIFFNCSNLLAKDSCIDKLVNSSKNISGDQKEVLSKVSQANLFFDTSQNMVGFINSPSSSYKLFISELIKKTPLFSENQTFQNYFADINPVDVNDIGGVTTNKRFYQCPGNIAAGDCYKIKTKLSSVLSAITLQTKNELSIIVTDLFLSVDELLTKKNRDKIAKPFAKILNQGDAIGIFGIQSAYEGKIFGICTNNSSSERTTYSGATSRPFFVILMGNKDIILNFKSLMDEQVIPKIGTTKVEFNLFTNDIIKQPYYGGSWPSASFSTVKGIKKGDVFDGNRSDLIEYIVEKGNQPLEISIDLSKIQTPYTLPLSNFSALTQGYMQISEKGSCENQWFDIGNNANITYFKDQKEDNIVTFDIFSRSKDDSMRFNRNFNYIFQIDFRAKTIADSLNKVWMKEPEWTFSCEQSDNITDPDNGRTKFPVLNLDSFYDLLEQIQKENFTESSISQLNLAVHMSK